MNSRSRPQILGLRNRFQRAMVCGWVVFLALLCADCSAFSRHTASPDLDANSLTMLYELKRDQPEIWRLAYWDGKPMVVTSEGVNVLTADWEIVRMEATPGVPLRDAVDSGGTAWAIEPSPQAIRLLQYKNGKWKEDHAFPAIAKPFQDVRLVVDGDRPAVMTLETFWRFRGGQWVRTDLPPGMGKGLPLGNFYFADASLYDLHLVLLGDELFVGINRGEDGGGISQLNLAAGNATWRNSRTFPVGSFAVGPSKTLWYGGGLMHLSAAYAGLYHYDGLAWRTLIEESGSIGDASPIFGRRSSITAVCFDPGESHLYLLAPDAGIFRREGDRVIPVVRFPAANNSTTYANGLLVGRNETFYVADYDAGILVFSKSSDHFRVRNVRFPQPATRPIHW